MTQPLTPEREAEIRAHRVLVSTTGRCTQCGGSFEDCTCGGDVMTARSELHAALTWTQWNTVTKSHGVGEERAERLIDAHRAEVLAEEADALVAACPDHGSGDEAWMDCPCEYAGELRRRASRTTTEATS